MAGRNLKPGGPGGFDSSDKVNSNTLKRHPKMDLTRNDLLQLLGYLEGELQARDVVIATLKAEKAKQLLYQAKYGRFGLGDPFSAMQRDSDNMKDNTFDESAIKLMYDNQLAQLENLIATQRKAQMKMREQMIAGDKKYQKVCAELEDEKRKHAQDTAQGDDVTYALEKERERLKQEVDFEKGNAKKMEKDLKKTLASLEEERASSAKHKQVALMLIKERKKLVEKLVVEKQKADHLEKVLNDEKSKAMNMAEGLVQESKKSLKMEATMERQLSEFDLEREQMKNKLQREENRSKDLQLQVDQLKWQLESLQKQTGKSPKELYHSVEVKSQVSSPQVRLSSERTQAWQTSGAQSSSYSLSGKTSQMKSVADSSVEREAGLSPRHSPSDLSVRKRDNIRYASPQPGSLERGGMVLYNDAGLEPRVAPVGAVSDKSLSETQSGHKFSVSVGGSPTVVSSAGRITVQTGSPTPGSGPVSPRRVLAVGRGIPPPIPPNKPVLPVTTQLSKAPSTITTQKLGGSTTAKDGRVSVTSTGSKPVHIPVSVVHTTATASTASGNRTPKREGSPTSLRKPAQLSDCDPRPPSQDGSNPAPSSDSFDFLGPEMADLQQLLVSMVSVPQDSTDLKADRAASSSSGVFTTSSSSSSIVSSSSATTASHITAVSSISSSTSSLQSSSVLDRPSGPRTLSSSAPISQPKPSSSSSLPSSLVSKIPVGQQIASPRESALSSSTTAPIYKKSTDVPTSPIHRFAAQGNIESLRKLIVELDADVNLPMKDGTTPAHCAAEYGHYDCLKLLIDHGCHVNSHRDDQFTPVHCAAAQGHSRCLGLLLTSGGSVSETDQRGWTPLHWAASHGHVDICMLLLKHGASRTALSNTNWTPCHTATHAGQSGVLDLLLTYDSDPSEISKVRQEVCQVADKDGWTLAHLAASRESHECLSVILTYCDIDVTHCDNWDRTVLDVCSVPCHQLLASQGNHDKPHTVSVEMCCTGSLYSQQQPFVIGQIHVHPNMDWHKVDSALVALLDQYFSQLDTGLRTKKISRLDPEHNGENISQFQLGLSRDSICNFSIGLFSWSPGGQHPDLTPGDLVCNNNTPTITVSLRGGGDDNYDSLAFDLLLPVMTISNYIRLLEQYKCVVFYGPEGTRKKQLVKRLARHIADKEKKVTGESRVTQVYLHRDFSHRDLVELLKSEGSLLPVSRESERASILLLFHMEKVNLARVLGGLLEHIDYRGPRHTFNIPGADQIQETYYFNEHFFLIGTMDKPRSTGLDLGLQQRFRWVHFRVNTEPVRNLLARHLLRRLIHSYKGELPPTEDAVFKAVEWLVCVWQRLNDGVGKLGLPDVVFGPDLFMPCPVESQDAEKIFDWLKQLWNETISPGIRGAVMRGKEGPGDGQHKVASTALYVLLQRALVPGCPLTGDEKDSYLDGFSGTNELDIPLKGDKTSPTVGNLTQRRPLHNGMGPGSGDIPRTRNKHRNSLGNDVSPYVMPSNNPSVKRRTLSETSLTRTEKIEIPIVHQRTSDQTSDVQAKVPKLEIRSPVLGLSIPLPNSYSSMNRMGTSTSDNTGTSHRRSTFSAHSRIPQPSSKRSRSSENLTQTSYLHAVRGGSHIRPTSPFSFSLTTPTSPLFSFKFMDKDAAAIGNNTSHSISHSSNV